MKIDSDEMHDAIPGAPPGHGGANCCHMPTPEEPKMAEIYANMAVQSSRRIAPMAETTTVAPEPSRSPAIRSP
jgi:hypothetical protein